jgi:hypothetical protein
MLGTRYGEEIRFHRPGGYFLVWGEPADSQIFFPYGEA